MLRRIGRGIGVRLAALGVGGGAAAWPLAALAEEATHAEAASRALGAPQDVASIALITVSVLLALFIVATLGFLYRRERHLDWLFQRPDAPRDDHH